jgi:hypothetical protein
VPGGRNLVPVVRLLVAAVTCAHSAVFTFTSRSIAAQKGHEQLVRLLLGAIPPALVNAARFTVSPVPLHAHTPRTGTDTAWTLSPRTHAQALIAGRQDGSRPLHVAALEGHTLVAGLLLEAGAELNACTKPPLGQTALV